MKKELTCIICPLGCTLIAETDSQGNIFISGNRCPRGMDYAREELMEPKRTLTATVEVKGQEAFSHSRRLPVRSTQPVPIELTRELLAELYSIKIDLPVKIGQPIIKNWKDTGIDIVSSRSLAN